MHLLFRLAAALAMKEAEDAAESTSDQRCDHARADGFLCEQVLTDIGEEHQADEHSRSEGEDATAGGTEVTALVGGGVVAAVEAPGYEISRDASNRSAEQTDEDYVQHLVLVLLFAELATHPSFE